MVPSVVEPYALLLEVDLRSDVEVAGQAVVQAVG